VGTAATVGDEEGLHGLLAGLPSDSDTPSPCGDEGGDVGSGESQQQDTALSSPLQAEDLLLFQGTAYGESHADTVLYP